MARATIEQMIADLTAGGWISRIRGIWQSPAGACYPGPYRAWRVLRADQIIAKNARVQSTMSPVRSPRGGRTPILMRCGECQQRLTMRQWRTHPTDCPARPRGPWSYSLTE